MPRVGYNNVKWGLKDFIKLALGIAFLVLVFWIVLEIAVVPKTPATAEQVWDVLVAQGYEPQDITEKYFEKDLDFKAVLTQSIAIEKDDLRFEFFVFNNRSSAIDVYGQFHAEIIMNYNAISKVERVIKIANYTIHTLKSLGKYNVAIYVETTVVYAHCDEDNENEINKILAAIDYLE